MRALTYFERHEDVRGVPRNETKGPTQTNATWRATLPASQWRLWPSDPPRSPCLGSRKAGAGPGGRLRGGGFRFEPSNAPKPRSISEQCEVLAVPSQMGRRMGSAFRGKHKTPGLCQKPHTLMPRVFRTWPWAQNQVARMLNFLRVGRAVRQKAPSSFVNPCRSPAPSWYPGPLELTASAPKRHGRFGVETPSCPLHLSAGFEP